MRQSLLYMRMLLAMAAAVAVGACASMGRPEGGPRDTEPPVFVKSNPPQGALNVDRNKITLTFDENVTVNDIMTKVVVSPAQRNMPNITATGRNVNVELRDTMLPNTTYTIDFSDAIKDLNEGNELDGFAYAFSTGPQIDTLQISGMVFQASNLEPAQGMLVGVYSNLSDTAITTLPFERITKTNQLGQFTLRNLKEGTYRIYALTDNNRDYHWDRSEDVAFYDVTITPTAEPYMDKDTLTAADGSDSIVPVSATRYHPDDVLLTWFNEKYKPQFLSKYERPVRNQLYFEMNAPSDSFPEITIINGSRAGERIEKWARINASSTLDSLEYWISDTIVAAQDSILLSARYLRTDSLDQLTWTTDTLKMVFRDKKKKEPKKKNKDEKSDSTANNNITYLTFKASTSGDQDVHRPIYFDSDQPIQSFDTAAVKFEWLVDTIWEELPPIKIYFPDSLRPMRMRADYEWEPGAKYKISIDSAAIVGIYGTSNKKFTQEFKVKDMDQYSNVVFNIMGLDTVPAVVELLDSKDEPVASVVAQGPRAEINFVPPGTYYARLFLDRNGNGKYDDGKLLEKVQPEEVFYYPKKLKLKQNWDLEQSWNIFELPVDMQKPKDIKKNKPKPKAGEREEKDPDEDEDEDEFGTDFGPGNNNGFNNNGRRNNNNNTFRGGNGFSNPPRANRR
ncbi:MAG: Ig-like domain-containing protein [Muribaculaceae bacterium]|nr:Ig-like domain-containing protein [Muribaculaceae bacterium]